MKLVSKYLIGALLLLPVCSVLAKPILSVTRSTTVALPQTMLTHLQGIGDYTITNNANKTLTITPFTNPNENNYSVQRITASGLDSAVAVCPQGDNFTLGANASCVVRMQVSSPVAQNIDEHDLFKVCPTASGTYGCSAPDPKTLTAADDLPSNAPVLKVNTPLVAFAKNKITVVTITNTGTIAANNVSAHLSLALRESLATTAKTTCLSIAAGATCTLNMPMDANLAKTHIYPSLRIRGSNTALNTVGASIQTNNITTTPVLIARPGAYKLFVSNTSDKTITGLSIDDSIPNTTGLTIDKNASSCASSLESGASCDYVIVASSVGHVAGSGTATIHYTAVSQANNKRGKLISQAGIIATNVVIVKTSIAINPDDQSNSQDIVATTSSGSFAVKNVGLFSVVGLNVSYSPSGYFSSFDTSGCASGMAAGHSCVVTYTVSPDHVNDTSLATITASADNAKTVPQSFGKTGLVVMGVDQDADAQHMGYKALLVKNITSDDVSVSSIVAPSSVLSGNITTCNATGSNCLPRFASTCYPNPYSKMLSAYDPSSPADSTCTIWFKANTAKGLQQDSNATQLVSVTTQSSSKSTVISAYVKFTYGNDLYVGGTQGNALKTDSSVPGYLAKYDGTNWSDVWKGDASSRSPILALNFFQGDLYIGGGFNAFGGDASANGIVRDAGADDAMQPLGSGLVVDDDNNDAVFALATHSNNLYVGGQFSITAGSDNPNIASWDVTKTKDEATWKALANSVNGPIYALAVSGTALYVGGNFELFDTATYPWYTFNNLATTSFSDATTSWSGIGGDGMCVNNGFCNGVADSNGKARGAAVYALTMLGNQLYIGGHYNGIYYNKSAKYNINNIASCDLSTTAEKGSCSKLSDGSQTGITGTVNALTVDGSEDDLLFVGGSFSGTANQNANNAMAWIPGSASWKSLMGADNANGVSGGDNPVVQTFAYLKSQNIFVGGSFTQAGNVAAANIANWDASTPAWNSLSTSPDISVHAMQVAPHIDMQVVSSP